MSPPPADFSRAVSDATNAVSEIGSGDIDVAVSNVGAGDVALTSGTTKIGDATSGLQAFEGS